MIIRCCRWILAADGITANSVPPNLRYDVALLYLQQSEWNLEAAIEAYKDDERWELEHPLEAKKKVKNGKVKAKDVGMRRFVGGR